MFNSEYPDQLFVLLCGTGMGGITCLAVLLCGFVTANSKSIIATQRARYVWTSLAIPIAVLSLYLPLTEYGFADCTGALGDLRDIRVEFGWLLTILFYALVASPVLTFLVGLWIYFQPSMYAKKQRGNYPHTSQIRLRRKRRRKFHDDVFPSRFPPP